MAIDLDISGLLDDALSNMKRYWLNREHFIYMVEYIAGSDLQQAAAEKVRCGISIMKTIETGENRWIVTLELPPNQPIVGNCEDIDGVWQWFQKLQAQYKR